ncbi:hypothetical protein RHSIM_Rhsim13G0209700 [Rhododendron simsii]|uniref:Uncharacterized protein n=1 Tax=Rhododendron simsii TaxID=118357 RepID=A0A834L6U7_RHOSS|nr:hypothetical protein RHSIM_Rhsim13G0209700 [Rhododendron simsii]
MSRHRRQPSQALPPEIVSGVEPVGFTDFSKGNGAVVVVPGHGAAVGTGAGNSGSSSTDKSTAPPTKKQDSQAAPGGKPPAGKPSAA